MRRVVSATRMADHVSESHDVLMNGRRASCFRHYVCMGLFFSALPRVEFWFDPSLVLY